MHIILIPYREFMLTCVLSQDPRNASSQFQNCFQLLGRRLADPTVLETLGVNFRQPAGPKARLHTPRKNDIFCDQSRGYFPHIWEFLALISADFLIVQHYILSHFQNYVTKLEAICVIFESFQCNFFLNNVASNFVTFSKFPLLVLGASNFVTF